LTKYLLYDFLLRDVDDVEDKSRNISALKVRATKHKARGQQQQQQQLNTESIKRLNFYIVKNKN